MGSLLYTLAREGARLERKQRAAEARQAREYQKILRAREREQAKKDKEAYANRRQAEVADRNQELINEYTRKYLSILAHTIERGSIDIYGKLKEMYHEDSVFCFDKKPPRYVEPELEPVPEKSWIESIFKSKRDNRLYVIKSNQRKLDRAREEYNTATEAYKQEEASAYLQWQENQRKKRQKFEESVSSSESAYLSGNIGALKEYIDTLIELSELPLEIVDSYKVGYQSYTKRILINITLKNRDDIFYAGGYRYLKQRDEFVPVKMKVTEANQRLRALMIELTLAIIVLLYQNDRAKLFECVMVNIYHEDVCCLTCTADKKVYQSLDLEKSADKLEFIRENIKAFKSLATGVKENAYLYQEDD